MPPFRFIAAAILLFAHVFAQADVVRAAEPVGERRDGRPARPAHAITFACDTTRPCPPRAGPGPADRAVHPFQGTLGRPCAYRIRATPEGLRKVRVCF